MRIPLLAPALASLCLALPGTAQDVQIFGGNGERAATTQILFGKDLMGGISIEHGQPIWQASHEEMRPELKGKLLRLGKDWWTTMTTSFALDIGGTKVPAGSYLLGLDCDKEGNFALAFLEAKKGLEAGAVPFPLDEKGSMNWKPDFTAALEMKENANDEVVEKMTMTLDLKTGGIENGSYTLAWGPHQLTAKVAVLTGEAAEAGHDKDGERGEHGKREKGEHGGRGK